MKEKILVATTSLFMAAAFPTAHAFGQQTSKQQTDPLINGGEEMTVYFGTFLLILAIAAIAGIISRRIEHAVFAALGLSLIPIALFFMKQ